MTLSLTWVVRHLDREGKSVGTCSWKKGGRWGRTLLHIHACKGRRGGVHSCGRCGWQTRREVTGDEWVTFLFVHVSCLLTTHGVRQLSPHLLVCISSHHLSPHCTPAGGTEAYPTSSTPSCPKWHTTFPPPAPRQCTPTGERLRPNQVRKDKGPPGRGM